MPQNKEFGLRSTFHTVILLLMVRRIPCPTSIGVVLAVKSSTAHPKERCAGAVCKTLVTIIRDVFRSQEKKEIVAKKAGYSWPESKPRRENQRTDRLAQRNCPQTAPRDSIPSPSVEIYGKNSGELLLPAFFATVSRKKKIIAIRL